jgi:hypothetical protein
MYLCLYSPVLFASIRVQPFNGLSLRVGISIAYAKHCSVRFIQSGNNMVPLICKKTCWNKKIGSREIALLSNVTNETCMELVLLNCVYIDGHTKTSEVYSTTSQRIVMLL